jgi:DNA-binding winged helix-turn-helix (wHTH) protein/Tfp pilus assembly protein PilF
MHSPVPSPAVLRFGVFEADLRSGELRKNGVKVKIQQLPYRALRLLLSRPNQVVSREELRQALWPQGVFVDFDRGISSTINRLRDALGDSADNPIFIETVDRRGYRWIAPTQLPPLPAFSTQTPQTAPLHLVAKAQIAAEQRSASAPEAKQASAWSASPLHWRWILVMPAIAILLALWNFLPRTSHARARNIVSGADANLNTPRHAANPEAEDFYLKGRYYWNRRTPEDLNKAVDYFTQAIVHDPNYASAYVGLADCYNLLREYSLMPASDAYPRAYAAAKRAVELDDHSSEAHASLAFASFWGMWDAAAGEREFRRAIELDPKNPTAHHWYATYLMTVHRLPEAAEEIERARNLNPASKSILADKGCILAAEGRREEAFTLLKQLETAEPDFISPHRYLKQSYFEAQDFPDYFAEAKKEAALLHDNNSLALEAAAEKGFAAGGEKGLLQNMRTAEKNLYDRGQVSPFALAEADGRLGNKREAIQYLNVAFDRHDDDLVNLVNDSAFKNMHDDAEYRELVAKVGLPAQK